MSVIDNLAWKAKGACVGAPIEWFFPTNEDGEQTNVPEMVKWNKRAVAVCATCPVKAECLEYAVTHPDPLTGVWGGTGERTRRRMRREHFLSKLHECVICGEMFYPRSMRHLRTCNLTCQREDHMRRDRKRHADKVRLEGVAA